MLVQFLSRFMQLTAIVVASSSSSVKEDYIFPTLAVGKDSSSLYYVNVSVGTPKQDQSLRIDIAQPYIWIPAKGSQCKSHECVLVSSYDNSTSSSVESEFNGEIFSFNFINSISLNGTFLKDIFEFNNVSQISSIDFSSSSSNDLYEAHFTDESLQLKNISFLNAFQYKNMNAGSLGLSGSLSNPTNAMFDSSFFFLDFLTESDVIDSPSYSLWLGGDDVPYFNKTSSNSSSLDYCGNLIIGAVDKRYYVGNLVEFDMIPMMRDNTTIELSYGLPIIPMGPIYIENSDGTRLNMTSTDFLEPALLDSRFTNTRLPLNTIIQIATQLDASYVEQIGSWIVGCSLADKNVKFDFEFKDLTIQVLLSDLLSRVINSTTGEAITVSDTSEEVCALALYPNSDVGFNILGGPFLKHIYLAADNDGHKVAIAKAASTPSMVTIVDSATSAVTASQVSRSSNNETITVAPIVSGSIPFATSHNFTSTSGLTLIPQQSSNITYPVEFTAVLTSNGLIQQGRSYYTTIRPTTTSIKITTSQFASIALKSINNSTINTPTMSAAAVKLQSQNFKATTTFYPRNNLSKILWITLVLTILTISWVL